MREWLESLVKFAPDDALPEDLAGPDAERWRRRGGEGGRRGRRRARWCSAGSARAPMRCAR